MARRQPRKASPESRRRAHIGRRKKYADESARVISETKCQTCTEPLLRHPRCVECGRHVWCNDRLDVCPGVVRHSGGCKR